MFEGLRGMLALPEDPNERAAAKQGLLAAGAAMMSSRGQNFLGAAGEGLGAGAQGYQGALEQQQKDQLRQAQTQHAQAQTQKTQADLARPALIAGIFNKRFSRPDPAIIKQSTGGAPNAVTPLSQVQKIGQQTEGGTQQPTSLPGAIPPAQLEEMYRGMAHDYAAAGEYDLADKFIGYAEKQKRELMKRETLLKNGKPVSVLTYKDGEEAASQYDALPNNEVVDMGGAQTIIDRNMPQAGRTFQKTATPDTVMRVAQDERASKRADERSRAYIESSRGQIVQTDTGPQLVDVRAGVARPVVGQDGKALEPKLKSLPPTIQKALLENDAALRKVDKALAAIDAYPAALGARNYLGDTIRQRSDPNGVNVRALVADIGSLKIHDRSGAAVTAAETPRLKPFIPAATDDPETVKKKIGLFREEYEAIQTDINGTYTREQGYRVPAVGDLPKKSGKGGVPEDIGGLLNKYGGK